ncbi:winged helix-turn-helix transcriptional regulator [Pseudonocardia sp. TRM90224]|uniref:winged helix-turn-helix transcriptional regulator n=1 Tax=Pseudonocardia sp. TRM90224 TaxID=2812678 RepID=UPI001E58B9D3|nr:helix-turn-helix domain-containing protein [Pseudonocardia sp. TRM90224]
MPISDAERSAHAAAVAACPTNQVLARLGSRWVGVVLKELAAGPRRSGELARALPGARRKVLTETLRHLEDDGVVARTVTPTVPPAVEYRLTERGRELVGVLATITDWAHR